MPTPTNKPKTKSKSTKPPIILAILDGWGIAPPDKGNAVTLAKTPVIIELAKKYSSTELHAYGKHVGLPDKQDGNSEAGHINLGSGRIVSQDSVEVTKAIQSGVFFKNPAFLACLDHIKKNKSNLHLIGLLSGEQSAHVNPEHLLALLSLARKKSIKNIYLHLFTDGRDSQKFIAPKYLDKLEKNLKSNEKIATIMGRYYAMDRKKNWENIKKAYDAMVYGKGLYFATPREAILRAYNQGENDEFVSPSIIASKGEQCAKSGSKNCTPRALISGGDGIIFFNLRSDRAREITKTFTQKNFTKMNPGSFMRKKDLKNLCFVAMTDFGPDLNDILTAFPSPDLKNTLPILMSDYKQLYVAENEKYAHVTYFFNGGYADAVAGEARIMVRSPELKSYDEKPEMSAYEVAQVIVDNLKNKIYNFITVNFANPDMVAHTGNLKAGIKAVEVVDECVGKLYNQVIKDQGIMLVTADHGNIEEMINLKTNEIDTKHSINPVPFILASEKLKNKKLKSDGILGDVAPTILDLAGIDKPKEMRQGLF